MGIEVNLDPHFDEVRCVSAGWPERLPFEMLRQHFKRVGVSL